MLTAFSSHAPARTSPFGRRAWTVVALVIAVVAGRPALAQPSATIDCGQPTKDGSVTLKFWVWADANGRHGFSYECEVTGILATMTPEQKAARIMDQLNRCFRRNRSGLEATRNGAVVTVRDRRQNALGVECTEIVDTTNEPTAATSAEIPGEFPYSATARLDGVPTEGIALLVIDTEAALATTAVPTVFEIYEQWQAVLGGEITPHGLVLEPRTGIGHTHFAFDLTDPGLDISVELARLETIELVLGDANCDGVLDFGDINPFVLALTDPAAWQAAYPDCLIAVADINGDGKVDFADINEFVGLLVDP